MAAPPDNVVTTQFGMPSQILGQCRARVNKFLDARIRVLMENIDDSMFRRAEQADNSAEQTLFFDAMRQIRLQRDELEERFRRNIADSFGDFLHGRFKGKSGESAGAAMELSLVENDSLEQDLAIEGMAKKARALFSDPLYAIRRRLESLTARKDLPDEVVPLDPGVLAHAFRDSISILDQSIAVELIIFKFFDKYVLTELGELYADINNYLIEKRLLPDLQPQQNIQTGHFRRPQIPPSSASMPGMADAEMQDGSEFFSMLQQAVTQGMAGGSGPWPMAGAPMSGGVGIGMGSGPWPAGAGGGVVAATPDVLSALSRLQQQSLEGEAVSSESLRTGILDTVSEIRGVAIQGVNPTEQTTIDIVSMLFDFIFDDKTLPDKIKVLIGRLQIPVIKVAILDKGLFARKTNPARKLLNTLAQSADGWLEEDTEEQKALLEAIEQTVNKVLDEFEDDVAVFERALADFEAFIEEQKVQAEQKEEQAAKIDQGKENLMIAKAVAGQAIEQVLDGSEVPDVVAQFLRTTWKDLLIILYMRNGSDSDIWKKVLNIAVTLVWSLQPKPTQLERHELSITLPALIRSLKEGMRRMSYGDEKQKVFFDVLADRHSSLTQTVMQELVAEDLKATVQDEPMASESGISPVPANTSEAAAGPREEIAPQVSGASESVADEAPEPMDSMNFLQRKVSEINSMIDEGRFQVAEEITLGSPDDAVAPEVDEFVEQAREMEDGTWLELTNEDGQVNRIKLSWRSLISGKIFFVNRQGMKVQEMTVYGLAAKLRGGQAVVLENVPVFDRAIGTLLSSMRKPEERETSS